MQATDSQKLKSLTMDNSYAQHPQVVGQSPFFYYNPDPKPDNRQHGHFSPHPNVQGPTFQQVTPVPSTPAYSRPTSSCSQTPMSMMAFNASFHAAMGSMASPRPLYQKPTILIQSDYFVADGMDTEMYNGYPSTPPLSCSGSSAGSPQSYDPLHTPMTEHGSFFPMESYEGVKEGCQSEVRSESLAGFEWSRSGSPPLTQGRSPTPHHSHLT